VSEAFRAPTTADAPAVARLMSEHWPDPVDEDTVRRQWSAPSFDVGRDARLDSAGYAHVEDVGDQRVWIELRGEPSAALVGWAESRASEKGRRAFAGSWTTNPALLDELERRGFRVRRYSQRMQIGLDAELPEPLWPDGVRIRTLRGGDERTFYDAHQEAFADVWEPVPETYEEWSHWLIGATTFDPALWFLALDGDEAAGYAICHVHPGDPELGWVQLLGVRRPWRGRGLGRALLLHAFGAFKSHGQRRVGLGVDSESPTGANRLYESVGMREVGRFEVREKVLA
jgi:mycothiol synthase